MITNARKIDFIQKIKEKLPILIDSMQELWNIKIKNIRTWED